MRRRILAMSVAVLSLMVMVPAGATTPEPSVDDGKVCVRSAILFGAGREYCVRWSES